MKECSPTCCEAGSIDGVLDGLDGLTLTVMGAAEHDATRGVIGVGTAGSEHQYCMEKEEHSVMAWEVKCLKTHFKV